LIAFVLVPGVAQAMRGFLPGMAFTPGALGLGVVVAVVLGVVVGLFPALKAMRLSIVDALGGR
ncbi:MAG: ABC transporter permease, partial [Xanthomonadales bacterium]|nr:ABC transporter permease [Xanthomonadales bacterium]